MTTEIAKLDNAAIALAGEALPDFLVGVKREDKSNLDQSDIVVPRIKIAQDGNPEVKSGDIPKGALFINVTGEIVAKFAEPLIFVPIFQAKEYILWRDQQDQGGGMLARAQPVNVDGKIRYKWNKPNTKFETKVKGVLPTTWVTKEYIDEDGLDQWGTQIAGNPDSPPAATVHYNYVVMLPQFGNTFAAFSLSKSQTKRAKDLNSMLEMSQLPIYARVIRVATEPEKNDAGQEFFNVRFKPFGAVKDKDLFDFTKAKHEEFASTGFVVEQGAEDTPAAGAPKDGKF